MKRAWAVGVVVIMLCGCDDSSSSSTPSRPTASSPPAQAKPPKPPGLSRVDAAKAASAKAEDARVAAEAAEQRTRDAFDQSLAADPQYALLKKDADERQAALDSARKGGSVQDRLDAGSAYNKARAALSKYEARARADSKDLAKSHEAVADARSRAGDAAQVAKVEEARTQAAADAADPAKQKEQLREAAPTFSAAQVVSAYKGNEIDADAKLKDRYFKVSGKIETVGNDVLGSPYVALSGEPADMFRSVQCVFSTKDTAKLADLRKGQKVVVFGRCEGLMMNVLLKDCELAK